MGLRLFFAAVLACAFPTGLLLGEVIHVRDYQSHERRDRGVLFALAVTPDQDVLSFVAKGDGKWRLTRIHGWLDKKPSDQTIDIPGWPAKKPSAKDSEFLSLLDVGLFVAPDGKFAACVAAGYWARNGQPGGRSDNLVSVVDLRTFSIVKTIRTSEVGEETWQVFMDPSGRLALQKETSGNPQQVGKLVILNLPDLSVQGQCLYAEGRRADNWSVTDEDGVCAAMLGRISGSPVSLREFIEGLEDAYGFPVHREAPAQPCPVTGVTRDHRFKKESCAKQHLSTWNRSPVTDQLTENILSLETGKRVGTVEETTRNSVQSRFADQNGHDYLLVVEGGTNLKVYEISAEIRVLQSPNPWLKNL